MSKQERKCVWCNEKMTSHDVYDDYICNGCIYEVEGIENDPYDDVVGDFVTQTEDEQ